MGTPEDVANLVSFLVSDEASYITGQAVRRLSIGILLSLVFPGTNYQMFRCLSTEAFSLINRDLGSMGEAR